ncbi:MAG: hypothetical protein L0216_01820 [Planctomycetales bacterium]|nr:hypothetical protein [Planctomycetales bacterium]
MIFGAGIGAGFAMSWHALVVLLGLAAIFLNGSTWLRHRRTYRALAEHREREMAGLEARSGIPGRERALAAARFCSRVDVLGLLWILASPLFVMIRPALKMTPAQAAAENLRVILSASGSLAAGVSLVAACALVSPSGVAASPWIRRGLMIGTFGGLLGTAPGVAALSRAGPGIGPNSGPLLILALGLVLPAVNGLVLGVFGPTLRRIEVPRT